MQKMWEMLNLRCKAAGLEMNDVFESKQTWIELCQLSGGHPRHLMSLLSSAANQQDDLPIELTSVQRSIREVANSLLFEIPGEFWPELAKYDAPSESMPHSEKHLEMLFALYIFHYANGTPWYEVNPIIRTLDRYQQILKT